MTDKELEMEKDLSQVLEAIDFSIKSCEELKQNFDNLSKQSKQMREDVENKIKNSEK